MKGVYSWDTGDIVYIRVEVGGVHTAVPGGWGAAVPVVRRRVTTERERERKGEIG